MDETTWRLTVTFIDDHDAEALFERLDAAELRRLGGSISPTIDENRVFAYAQTRESIEPVARAVRIGIDSIGIKPANVAVDRWLPDEARWSGDSRRRQRSTSGGSDLSEVLSLVDALFFWP